MDVIGFLCVSLGSSRVQLHDSLGSIRPCAYSEAGFSSKNGDLAWGGTTEQQRSFILFCGQKVSVQKIFIKKCFLFTFGSVCRVKRFTTGQEILSRTFERRRWNGDAEVAEKTLKRLLCCEFRRSGKAIGQVYQCLWRICREIAVFFSGSNITCVTFYIYLRPIYWLSLLELKLFIIRRHVIHWFL
jgi:hypothetical protein